MQMYSVFAEMRKGIGALRDGGNDRNGISTAMPGMSQICRNEEKQETQRTKKHRAAVGRAEIRREGRGKRGERSWDSRWKRNISGESPGAFSRFCG